MGRQRLEVVGIHPIGVLHGVGRTLGTLVFNELFP
jgi:hypothetical protein